MAEVVNNTTWYRATQMGNSVVPHHMWSFVRIRSISAELNSYPDRTNRLRVDTTTTCLSSAA